MSGRDSVVRDGALTLVDRTPSAAERPGPVSHGLERFTDAVEAGGASVETVDYWSEAERSTYVVAGTTNASVVERLLSGVDDPLDGPEGVVFRWCETRDGTALVVAGTDDRGLLYALSELADRIDARGLAALDDVPNDVQYPDNAVRGVDRYVQGPVADEWLYSAPFWEYYLARLARCRFNRFVLVTGYDSAFMSPPYPFLVDVPDYPEVLVTDDGGVSREENLDALRRIGDLCHRYGLEFGLGVWQQQPWSDVQGRLVEGLPDDDREFAAYCATGTYELLTQCPEIDVLQLRINHEAGVRDDAGGGDTVTAETFWRDVLDGVERAAADRGRPLDLDLRAKGLTDRMIDWGQETGLDVTVPTKFSWEAMGLPYHTTQLRADELANPVDPDKGQRYSYGSLLEKPRPFDVLYRLWMLGTGRIFLWGDPDYARRFSRAAQFGDGVGFEVGAPLGLKGGHFFLQDEAWDLHADPDLRHYAFEDERYWAWYLLFGRLGYDADAAPDVWAREFEARFGDAADGVREAYRAASKVLPLLTSAHLTHHPAQHNWGELDTGAALFADHNVNPVFEERATTYLDAEPGDPGLFYGVDEYVADRLANDLDGRYTPPQVARWYRHFATTTRDALGAAGDALGAAGDGATGGESGRADAELAATELDLLMVADLAEFHAEKSRAAVALAAYRRTDDPTELQEAYARADRALDHWRSLSERGEGAYHDDLVFALGPPRGDAGSWRDRLHEVEADRDRLGDLLDEAGVERLDAPVTDGQSSARAPTDATRFVLDAPERCAPDEPVTVTVATDERSRDANLRLRYRRADQTEGPFRTVEMERTDAGFTATVPAEYVVPEWDLLVYVSGVDERGHGIVLPGVYAPDHHAPYRVVEVAAERESGHGARSP